MKITINKPSDFHTHLRDGKILKFILKDHSKNFSRILAMPNLIPPITNIKMADQYFKEIEKHNINNIEVFTTLYLTENTTIEDIKSIKKSKHLKAVKLYPKGATTNSNSGVSNIKNIYHILEVLENEQIPLLIHGEVTDVEIDLFDREKIFIDSILSEITKKFPKIKLVMEHITTKNAVEFIIESGSNISATITPQHLLFNRNDMLVGGIKPHFYCLPILKKNIHQKALIDVATSGNPKFFLGTDSAPHLKKFKENNCGCAGCYTAFHAIELYATAFYKANKLDKLNNFASVFGSNFYSLPVCQDTITLSFHKWRVDEVLHWEDEKIVPLQIELDFKVV